MRFVAHPVTKNICRSSQVVSFFHHILRHRHWSVWPPKDWTFRAACRIVVTSDSLSGLRTSRSVSASVSSASGFSPRFLTPTLLIVAYLDCVPSFLVGNGPNGPLHFLYSPSSYNYCLLLSTLATLHNLEYIQLTILVYYHYQCPWSILQMSGREGKFAERTLEISPRFPWLGPHRRAGCYSLSLEKVLRQIGMKQKLIY